MQQASPISDKKESTLAEHNTVQQKPQSGVYLKDLRSEATRQKGLTESLSNKITGVPVQKKANTTGLPDQLKSGIENLSGHSMDDVKVHYNSSQPAQLNAHAYAQGNQIHLAPGQEKHLPHEAWHVVQQKQGRVKPTVQMKGKVNVNDDAGLEKEADVMGAKALKLKSGIAENLKSAKQPQTSSTQAKRKHILAATAEIVQRIQKEKSNPNSPENIDAITSFTKLTCQLAKYSTGSKAPLQFVLAVAGSPITNRGTIHRNVLKNRGTKANEKTLIKWAEEANDMGHNYGTWLNAIHAAGQEMEGKNWNIAKTIGILLLLILLVVGGGLFLRGSGSPSSSPESGTVPRFTPQQTQQLDALSKNPDVIALQGMCNVSEINAMGNVDLAQVFPGADSKKIQLHSDKVKGALESVGPALKSQKGKIATAKAKPPVNPKPKVEEKETIVNKKGTISFGNAADQKRFTGSAGDKNYVESKAINNLMKTTKHGKGIADSISELGLNPVFIREDLGWSKTGEADASKEKYIKLHSKRSYAQNAITAAHELKHKEQFKMGQLDVGSSPYRMATAEIYAKTIGLNVYEELLGKGYIPKNDKDTQDQEADLVDYKKDKKAYERQVFKTYHNRYSKGDTKAFPNFKDDAALDKHIADQKAYFETREKLFRVEKEIKAKGHSIDSYDLPEGLKTKLTEARIANRNAKAKANKSQPKVK